ncbi:MAG TPA: hypothetical protein VN843_09490 [Anaerolineales bacterium]|nr:hypothetical protein [Anaerolineales bacterium]
MDWATFFKDYPAVIPAVSALLVAILGFVFNRWNDNRKRNFEIESRQFSKRAEVHDLRIKEVREVLDKWSSFMQYTEDFTKILTQEKSLKEIIRKSAIFEEEFKGVLSMRHETIIKEPSIDILNDKELSDLRIELSQKLQLPLQTLVAMVDNLEATVEAKKFDTEKNNVGGMKDITRNVDLDASGKDFREAKMIITKMKIRLDELAKTIK